jgi:hypothetical protein
MSLRTVYVCVALIAATQALAQTPTAVTPTAPPAPAAAQEPAPQPTAPAPAAAPEVGGGTAPVAAQPAPQPTTTAVATAKKPLKRPPGYKIVKRDGVNYYCRKDASIGSRVETLKCYSEKEMEVQLLTQDEERSNMHQRMRTCAGSSCVTP